MPTLGGQLVRSPAFALDLRGRNPAAFVREVEDGAVRIVGRYVPRMEALRSWDIRGSNVHLNRVFELNRLPYGGYPGDDAVTTVDRRGKKAATTVERGSSRGAMIVMKKRKLGTVVEGLGVPDRFPVDLMGTCAAPGGRMSSLELRESSARMLEVTEGRWPRSVPIPRAAGEDMFTSRLAREMKIFPYRRNIASVVSAVMDKDHQDAMRKRWAFTRVGDPSREVKKARAIAKSAAPGPSGPSGARAIAPGSSKPSAQPTQERRPPSPLRAAEAEAGGADLSMDICVDDYRVGGVMMFDAHTGRGFAGEFFLQDCDAGSDAGQLAVAQALVTAAPVAAAVESKGASQDPWSKFCASGEITSAAIAKDVAGFVAQQLKHAVQQLKHVSCLGLCQFVVFM
jgi:hypothetical protein